MGYMSKEQAFAYGLLHDSLKHLISTYTNDPELIANTPNRVIKAYQELLAGYDQNPKEILKEFDMKGKKVAVYETCEFYSLCEHHMIPFYGKVHIAYVTEGKCFGLSKLARLVEVYARRLQIQERMTDDIADALYQALGSNDELGPNCGDDGVLVITEAKHLCMCMRGIKKQDSMTVMTAKRGRFAIEPQLCNETLAILREKNAKKPSKKPQI